MGLKIRKNFKTASRNLKFTGSYEKRNSFFFFELMLF